MAEQQKYNTIACAYFYKSFLLNFVVKVTDKILCWLPISDTKFQGQLSIHMEIGQICNVNSWKYLKEYWPARAERLNKVFRSYIFWSYDSYTGAVCSGTTCLFRGIMSAIIDLLLFSIISPLSGGLTLFECMTLRFEDTPANVSGVCPCQIHIERRCRHTLTIHLTSQNGFYYLWFIRFKQYRYTFKYLVVMFDLMPLMVTVTNWGDQRDHP